MKQEFKILEAKPSEALELIDELDNCLISDMSIEVDDYDESNYCMSYEYIDFNGEGLQFNDNIKEETIIDFIREKKISTIKQALLKAQKQEKENAEYKEVLRIIFEKSVDIDFLKSAITFEEYNKMIKFKYLLAIALTEEEFDLLKRWCEHGI